mmetsp:Transcript_30034/g.95889  ORF Transcript_30034/g.95889 Transcript_30034/m.95889 type:complete len:258 (-) Transcript_30034:7-780(-)
MAALRFSTSLGPPVARGSGGRQAPAWQTSAVPRPPTKSVAAGTSPKKPPGCTGCLWIMQESMMPWSQVMPAAYSGAASPRKQPSRNGDVGTQNCSDIRPAPHTSTARKSCSSSGPPGKPNPSGVGGTEKSGASTSPVLGVSSAPYPSLAAELPAESVVVARVLGSCRSSTFSPQTLPWQLPGQDCTCRSSRNPPKDRGLPAPKCTKVFRTCTGAGHQEGCQSANGSPTQSLTSSIWRRSVEGLVPQCAGAGTNGFVP